MLHRAANIMESQADAWTEALTRKEGKTRLESQREIVRVV